MTDMVCLSLEAWDQVWRRNQYLMAGLLRSDPTLRVLFVEPPADPLYDVACRRTPQPARGLRRVPLQGASGRLWAYQPTKLLPRRIDPWLDLRLAHRVRAVAARLGFTDPVLWINDPAGAKLLQVTGWPALYDITDDWVEADRTPAEHARVVADEAFLLDRCAEVVVCSPTLARTKGAVRPVTLVPNAVDVAAYGVPRPRPSDLPQGPVALYLGTVHSDRIDLDLCVATASGIAGCGTLVLVGPAPLAPSDAQRLRDAGVVLLGARDRTQVPGYLQHADVLVVPHVITPFTESLDPIKLYEYAAVGRPVVSTPVAGFREVSNERVTVASGEGFVDAVRLCLPAEDHFPAGAEPGVPDWSLRVAEVSAVLDRVGSAGRPLRLIVDVLNAPADSGGMRRYAEELIHGWFENGAAAHDELIVHGEPWVRDSFAGLDRVRPVVVERPTRRRRLTAQWFGSARLWWRECADAVLALGPVVTGLVPRRARYCVVHDWRHLRRPEEFSVFARWYRRVWLHSLRTARAVFAISEKTRAETVAQVPRANVVTVPNGTDHPRRWTPTPQDRPSPQRVILTYGHRAHKRPGLVLEAFARLPREVRGDARLLVLGARGADAERLRADARTLGVADQIDLPGFVSEAEYQRAVAEASVVVLASTDEGYGLPVVEARYFGHPVVVTDDSGLPEIHGDLVISVPPTASGLADGLTRALAAPRQRYDGRRWADTAAAIRAQIAYELGSR